MSDQTNDLSHVFANSDLDAAQEHHGNLPDEAMLHFARAFAAKEGLIKHPGLYSGPPIKPPEGWQTPQDEFGQKQEEQSQALNDLSESGTPTTTPLPGATGAAKPLSDQKAPDFSSL